MPIYFFALTPPFIWQQTLTKLIEHSGLDRPVSMPNLHLTLAHLHGAAPKMNEAPWPPIVIQAGRIDTWVPGHFALTLQPSEALYVIAQRLQHNHEIDEAFRPHITLGKHASKSSPTLPNTIDLPPWVAETITLYERVEKGTYLVRDAWPLKG